MLNIVHLTANFNFTYKLLNSYNLFLSYILHEQIQGIFLVLDNKPQSLLHYDYYLQM